MKYLFLLSVLFISATVALKFDRLKNVQDSECAVTKCVPAGSSCTNFDQCTICANTFQTCIQNASTQGYPAMCSCWNTYITCAAQSAFCGAEQIKSSCVSLFQSLSVSCPCGGTLPPPPSNTVDVCDMISYCDNGVCHAKKPAGAPCTKDDECGPNYFGGAQEECHNGTCRRSQGWANVNDGCSSDYDCPENVRCVNQVCQGEPLNSRCAKTSECGFNLFCNRVFCTRRSPVGGLCDPQLDGQCTENAVCGYGNKCVQIFSGAIGTRCNSTAECQLGLVCNAANQCANPTAPPPCQTQSDCPDGTWCGCSQDGTHQCVGPNTFPEGSPKCTENVTAFIKCTLANSCVLGDLNMDPSSCFMKHCGKEANCMVNCLFSGDSANAACLGPVPQCASSPLVRIN